MRAAPRSMAILAMSCVLAICPAQAAPSGLATIALPIEQAAYELTANQFVWQDTGTGEGLIDADTIGIPPEFEAPNDVFGHLPRRAVRTERCTRFRCNEGVLVDEREVVG